MNLIEILKKSLLLFNVLKLYFDGDINLGFWNHCLEQNFHQFKL